MPLFNLNTTVKTLLEHDPKRKCVWITIKTAGKDVYISDIPGMTNADYKWNLQKGDMLVIDRQNGFPDRAFYGIGDGSVQVLIGSQNEDDKK